MASQDAENHHSEGWGWAKIDWLYSEYMWVWVGLFVFTVVEVFIPEPEIFAALFDMILPAIGPVESMNAWLSALEFNRTFVVVSLIVIALIKTWMVAWYYMHLIAESPAIILVACAPFLFSLFLTVGIFPWQGAF